MQKNYLWKQLEIYLFLLALPFVSSAQNYHFKNYSDEIGYPIAPANKFFQDDKGFIWICTEGEGVTRFDGRQFTTFSEAEGLGSNYVKDISQDKHGIYWIASDKGVSTFDGSVFKTPELHEKRDFAAVNILIDKTGREWILTRDKKLYIYDSGSRRDVGAKLGETGGIYCLKAQDDGKIWMGAENGLYVYENNGFRKIEGNTEGSPIVNVSIDSKKNIWACSAKEIFKIKDDSLSRMNLKLGNCTVSAIINDKQDNLWVATSIGLFSFDSSIDSPHASKIGFENTFISTLFLDREDNLWIGSDLLNISILPSLQISNFTDKTGLNGNSVLGITSDMQGHFWFVTAKGINVYNGEEIKSLGIENISKTYFISPDSAGNIWVRNDKGLTRCDSKRFTKATSDLPTRYSFLIDEGGSTFDSQSKTPVNFTSADIISGESEVFQSSKILCSLKDKEGDLWIGTDKEGLFLRSKKNGTFNPVLPDNFLSKEITSLVADKEGNIWVGTGSKGLYKLKLQDGSGVVDNVFKNQGKNGKPINRSVRSLIFDSNGYLWIGTDAGIFAFNTPLYNRTGKVITYKIKKQEGLKNAKCNPNAVYRDKKGYLWFGTKGGAVRLYPALDHIFKTSPQTYISNVKLFYKDVNWKKYTSDIIPFFNIPANITLSHSNNYLTFEFTSPHFSNPKSVNYQFRLLPSEDEWLPITDKKDASYSNLKPGKYQFEVRSTINGFTFSEPATFNFSISKPFWSTWWFFGLVAFLIVGAIYTYISNNTRSLKIIQRDLEIKVQQRTSQLEEQKNKLQDAYKVIEEKNSEITDSIRYAKNIQEAILPPLHLLKNFLPESFVFFMPKDIVSGDFYWLAQTDTKVVVAAVDCTGHGVPGAFMSFVGYNLLNQIVNQSKITTPSQILNDLNISLNESLRNTLGTSDVKDGMDIAICTIDIETKIAEYAGAYNPLYHIRNKQLTIYSADRFPVGSYMEMNHKKFTNHSIQLLPGDSIYIFTDGYSDQFGGKGDKKFMYSRFRNLLLNVQDLNMTEQKLVLYKEFHNWKGVNEQVDDVLVIGIRI